ncbi:hypothetical protein HanIR_Chr05g0236361 [Helianthus annuus]|nr:hypothetical protein HanIR_Chr05g0236361 [Helianthus annuus]
MVAGTVATRDRLVSTSTRMSRDLLILDSRSLVSTRDHIHVHTDLDLHTVTGLGNWAVLLGFVCYVIFTVELALLLNCHARRVCHDRYLCTIRVEYTCTT